MPNNCGITSILAAVFYGKLSDVFVKSADSFCEENYMPPLTQQLPLTVNSGSESEECGSATCSNEDVPENALRNTTQKFPLKP